MSSMLIAPLTSVVFLLIAPMAPSGAKVQCSCPKIQADGDGITSCSASENRGRCTIDFNLFGPDSEKRAADWLRRAGRIVAAPDPNASAEDALLRLSRASPQQIVDAVLVYLVVAAANQSVRERLDAPPSLAELVKTASSDAFARQLALAFGVDAQRQWSSTAEDILRTTKVPALAVDGATVSPGCLEFTTAGGLWMMFKTNWSAARLLPRCGDPGSIAR